MNSATIAQARANSWVARYLVTREEEQQTAVLTGYQVHLHLLRGGFCVRCAAYEVPGLGDTVSSVIGLGETPGSITAFRC